jgi:GxxExxY protein
VLLLTRMMKDTPVDIDSLTEKIIGCAIEVHRELGPGLLECIYRECLCVELEVNGLKAVTGRHVNLQYKGKRVAGHLELDLLVEDSLILELKAVEKLHPVHVAQLITYLKLTGCPAGLLLNFNQSTLRAGLRRVDHPERYVRKTPAPTTRDLQP